MKTFLTVFSIYCLLGSQIFAQENQEEQALEYIKTGNTLREGAQFERAEEFLLKGLEDIKDKNKYWEASAYENLGLLYRDQGRSDEAIINFRKALKIYKSLRSATSAKVITALLEGVEEKEQLYAGIEIGAKGVKLSVVGIRLGIEGHYLFDIKKDYSINPNVVSLSDKAIDEAVEIINTFLGEAKKDYKISEERIFIVGSSGVKAEAEKEGKLDELSKRINNGIKDYKKEIKFITPEQEAFYAIKGSTLPRYRGNSTTIDIGSGNTKGGFLKGKKLDQLAPLTFDFGTATFSQTIADNKIEMLQGYDSVARYLAKEYIFKDVKKELANNSGFRTRRIVHLAGGAPWAMTSLMYPEKINDMFVQVSPAAIRKFRIAVMKEHELITAPNLSFIADEAVREKAEAEIQKVNKLFNREEMIAGTIILDALVHQLNKDVPKKFYFARMGYIGWITGYIMESVSNEYALLDE
ncbi:MAG: tetratricopeptide repeat protein [Bacteroidota bacterium]